MTPVPGGEGLQHERTALAWQRTAITAVVVLLPLLLVDARLGAWPLVVLGGLSTVVGVALVGRTAKRLRHLHGRHERHERRERRERHERRDHPAGESSSPWPPMRAVALVATLAAAGAVATALTVALS
jgi:uncharacterized membrane protein YidH (DUF202 family)